MYICKNYSVRFCGKILHCIEKGESLYKGNIRYEKYVVNMSKKSMDNMKITEEIEVQVKGLSKVKTNRYKKKRRKWLRLFFGVLQL